MSHDDPQQQIASLAQRLEQATARLAETREFAKFTQSAQVVETARRLMALPGGVNAVFEQIGALESAGIFSGSDWAHPGDLRPEAAANTLKLGGEQNLALECLSELRLAAIATGRQSSDEFTPEAAARFLGRVLAHNLRLIFGHLSESDREGLGRDARMVREHQRFIAEQIGYGEIIEQVIAEIWRILAQRPIDTHHVQEMVTRVAVHMASEQPSIPANRAAGAERLVSALFGPTAGCREDPGLEAYRERLESMDEATLRNEALAFGRAMHDTGLVSAYHAVFLRTMLESQPDLIPATLGLSSTGSEVLACYRELVHQLIREAVWPETAQAIYGLSGMLERGVLYHAPVAPALWRQIHLELSAQARELLGPADPDQHPSARVRLLAGLINVLGMPRGIGQGDNPTCQSARALSLWSTNDPAYLLQVVAWAARDHDVTTHFEGSRLSSAELLQRHPAAPLWDVDPVSAVTVPHLDALYQEMGRFCAHRGEDPHRWVNLEFHGWWVGHGFAIAVDVASGQLMHYAEFLRRFHACYHPLYNGNNPVIHAQPAGIAVTDPRGQFMGWHAISIERVACDHEGVMRVYFFNPNNDSTQDWGLGVRVSTEGAGERHGESSLPFDQFASRLYIFHFDPRDEAPHAPIPDEALTRIEEMARASWAANR